MRAWLDQWWRFIDYYGQQLFVLVFIIAGAVILFYGLEQTWKAIRKMFSRKAPPAAETVPDAMRKNEREEMRKHDPLEEKR